MGEYYTMGKKSFLLQQIVIPYMSVLLFRRVSEHAGNSELFDTLYTEFPEEIERACHKRLIENKLS